MFKTLAILSQPGHNFDLITESHFNQMFNRSIKSVLLHKKCQGFNAH